MRALLNLAHCHGGVLGTAWYTTLATLQHLTQILGLKLSSSGGSNKAIQANELPNLVSVFFSLVFLSFPMCIKKQIPCGYFAANLVSQPLRRHFKVETTSL